MKVSRVLFFSISFLVIATLFTQCVKKDDNTKIPIAILYISPTTGTLTTVFTFDGSASHDGSSSTAGLMYRWDANSDGNWDIDWTTESIIEVTFNAPGSYEVIMEVKNAEENSATDSKHITVTNSGGGILPTVSTTSVTNIAQNTATCGGNVTDQGTSSVTARGVCWSTSSNPTTSDSHTTDGSGTGTFTSNITGLTAATSYYVRAYATNSSGTAYGNQQSFITSGGGSSGVPCPGIPIVSYEGQTYNTVLIGSQCWLKENLNVGTMINISQDATNNGIIEKYCYENNPANCAVYGGTYQWQEMMQYSLTSGVQGICPTGWHLPSVDEWTTLTTFLGGESIAGGKLKEAGFTHWLSPNTGATNSSGFTALPGGVRNVYGESRYLGASATFWSSTVQSAGTDIYAIMRGASHVTEGFSGGTQGAKEGYAVRCVKD